MAKQKAETPSLVPHQAPLLMLMDGHALVHQSWHAFPTPLSISRTGEIITGAFGFTSTFLKALQDWQPTHCAIAFDRPTPTFRHIEFKEYKATRPEAPPELRQQFVRVRQLMEAFAIPVFELDGFEADDILVTLSRQAQEIGLDTIILTRDTDILQCVSPLVRVVHYRIQERKVYDEKAVRERYGGLGPHQLPDFKALRGDKSDNIPGVPGIGDKTATRLLLEFGNVEEIYQNLDRVDPKLRPALEQHRQSALKARHLNLLVTDVPVQLDLEASRFGSYDRAQVVDLFRELEFSSLLSRVPEGRRPTPQIQPPLIATGPVASTYRLVDTAGALQEMLSELRAAGAFAFDVETTHTDPVQARLVGLSFSASPGRAYYVPVGHREGPQLPPEQVASSLKPLLEDPSLLKTGHNANFDMTVLEAAWGLRVAGLQFDTMIAAHLLGKKAIGLKALALDLLGQEMTHITALIGTGAKQTTMDNVPIPEASAYACADADMTWRLRSLLKDGLEKDGLWKLFAEEELPLVPVLVRMQLNGVAINVPLLRQMSQELHQRLQRLESEVYSAVGHQFNINSPQQLSDVLFKELRLMEATKVRAKRTKTGYSTDAASLEALKGAHPVIDLILEYRQLSKLKSTYVDALPEMVNPRTGRLHTSYNQAGVVTGRVSSSEPNIQNIPIRTELGRQVRKAFVPGQPGWLLMAADYSQVELRVLAHISRDEGLLAAFARDEDIHAATASLVYGVPLSEVTPDMRRIAKVLNFGVLYGLSPYGISQQTDLNPEQGAQFIETYFAKFPGIRQYIEGAKEQARRLGYVETLLRRRRYMPEINSSNFVARQAAEREAINMPIQGTAAEIIKRAMVRLQERMDAIGLRSMMTIQVHDELIFEVPPEELETMRSLILEVMPGAIQLAVPLKVAVKVGPSWGDLE